MKKWTEREVNYLMNHSYTKTYEEMAKHLKRSTASVADKARKIGYGSKSLDDRVPVSYIAKLLNKHSKTLWYWREHHEFPSFIHAKTHYIEIGKFWAWAKNHQDLVDVTLIPRNELPPEPSWVEEARRLNIPVKNSKRTWSDKEIKELENFVLYSNLTNEQIGNVMKRSAVSISKMINYYDFNNERRKKVNGLWTEREEKELISYIENNIPVKDIAIKLNRSTVAIYKKIKRMEKKGEI